MDAHNRPGSRIEGGVLCGCPHGYYKRGHPANSLRRDADLQPQLHPVGRAGKMKILKKKILES